MADVPVLIGTLCLFAANFLSLLLPWTGLNVNVISTSYAYQVEEDIGIFSCVDTTTACGGYCCAKYNNGQLFDFWLKVIPLIPQSHPTSDMASILFPFQIASYIALVLTACSFMTNVYSVIALISYKSSGSARHTSLKSLRSPLRIAIFINLVLVLQYVLITFPYLNGGYYSYSLWVSGKHVTHFYTYFIFC
jgi:hypothetical protein